MEFEAVQESLTSSKIGGGAASDGGASGGGGDNIEVVNFDGGLMQSWDDYDFPPSLLRAIFAKGFEEPSAIQKRAILPMIQGRDLIAQSPSGTGKTATFSIGCISSVDSSLKCLQAIILANTIELASQTHAIVKELGVYDENLNIQLMIGGRPVSHDIETLQRDFPQIVVGTPGRVFDMMNRNYFDMAKLKMIVLDEADEMLTGTFTDQVRKIFTFITPEAQVILFSATFPEEIKRITAQILRVDHVQITVKAEDLTLKGIQQYFVRVDNDEQKFATLQDLYRVFNIPQCMIFVNSVERAVKLTLDLRREGFPVCCLHRDMEKTERESSLLEFRQGKFRIMVSTNISARGIDVQQVSLVINYDVPKDKNARATYLHRIGRSGRFGRKGTAVNFATVRDTIILNDIQDHYRIRIDALPENPTL